MFSKLTPILFLIILFSTSSCKKELNINNTLATDSEKSQSTASKRTGLNIILFVADDLGIEVPHFTGGDSYQTPNLDFLAARGKYFTQAYSHPDGYPSRLALLTGKYNFRNYTFWGNFPKDNKTIGNLLQDAGYATCYLGKWQNNGGDSAIKSMGFDKYRIYLPFISDNQRIQRYKDPLLYENGAYMDPSLTQGKYSEDLFYEYLSNFIDSNKIDPNPKPFFALYSFNLVAQPYVPSPDHPDYATWNSADDRTRQDTSYFASMVSYLDKIVGKVIDKVKNAGLKENTLILFCADNATQSDVISSFNGAPFRGTKTTTTKYGTLTPLLAYLPGTIAPGQTDSALIDYTDFLPTLANAGRTAPTAEYGYLDGTTFFDNMVGVPKKDRKWVFCKWDNDISDFGITPAVRYTNNTIYKLYDRKNEDKNFYNMLLDPYEKNPIPQSSLTPTEIKIKNGFKQVLATLK